MYILFDTNKNHSRGINNNVHGVKKKKNNNNKNNNNITLNNYHFIIFLARKVQIFRN